MTVSDAATTLLRLHRDPDPLIVVNVWDVISATVVADLEPTKALATASHSIAASHGYEDGEAIPRDLMITAIGRIAAAVDVPVSADLEAGYGDVDGTIRAAIGVGIAGANLEDAMRPFDEAVANVRAAVAAAEAEGVPAFALNARTDAFVKAGDRDPAAVLRDAVERGKAFLDAGAACVFVPGKLDEAQVTTLVEALGPQRLSVIAVPGSLSVARLGQLGVARISYGPWTQRVALTALADLGTSLYGGGDLSPATRPLN